MIAAWRWPYHDVAAQWACSGAMCLVPSPDGRTLWAGQGANALAFDLGTGRSTEAPCAAKLLTVTDDAVFAWGFTGTRLTWEREAWQREAWRATPVSLAVREEPIAAARDAPTLLCRGHHHQLYWDGRPLPLYGRLHQPLAALDAPGRRAAIVGGERVGEEALFLVTSEGAVRRVHLPETIGRIESLYWLGDDLLLGTERGIHRLGPGRLARPRPFAEVGARSLAVSRDGLRVAALAERDASIALLRADDGAIVGRWRVEGVHCMWEGAGRTRTVDVGARLVLPPTRPWMPRSFGELALAPDGAWCAVIVEGGVLLLGADGAVRGLPQGGAGRAHALAWSGDQLAVGHENTPVIRVVGPDAAEAQLLLECEQGKVGRMIASNDGRLLAAISARGGCAFVEVFDRVGGVAVAAFETSLPSHSEFVWGHEGGDLWGAFTTDSDLTSLVRLDLRSRVPQTVWARPVQTPEREGWKRLFRTTEGFDLLSGHLLLRFDRGGSMREELTCRPHTVYRTSIEGRAVVGDLVVGALGGWDARNRSPRWSSAGAEPVGLGPSGRWFVGRSDLGSELFVIATATGARLAARRVRSGAPYALSPDGGWLAYVVDGVPSLCRLDVPAIEAACDAVEGAASRPRPPSSR